MEIIKDNKHIARKIHKCNFCCQQIQVGEKYRYAFCKDDYVYTWKNHLYCDELASKLGWFGEGVLTEDDFWEYVSNEFDKLDISERKTFTEKLDLVLKHNNIEKNKPNNQENN